MRNGWIALLVAWLLAGPATGEDAGSAPRPGRGASEIVERAVERTRSELDASGLKLDSSSVTTSFVLTTTIPLCRPVSAPSPAPAASRRELITDDMLRGLKPDALRLEPPRPARRRRRKR